MLHASFRAWSVRTIATFLVVYVLGLLCVPTMIPYLAAIIASAHDGIRVLRRAGRHEREPLRTEASEALSSESEANSPS